MSKKKLLPDIEDIFHEQDIPGIYTWDDLMVIGANNVHQLVSFLLPGLAESVRERCVERMRQIADSQGYKPYLVHLRPETYFRVGDQVALVAETDCEPFLVPGIVVMRPNDHCVQVELRMSMGTCVRMVAQMCPMLTKAVDIEYVIHARECDPRFHEIWIKSADEFELEFDDEFVD